MQKTTKEQRETITNLYLQNLSYDEISNQTLVSKSTINVILKEANLIGKRHNVTIGGTYGKLTVVKHIKTHIYKNGSTSRVYECQCSCGNITNKHATNLKQGVGLACKLCLNENLHNVTKVGQIPSRIMCGIRNSAKKRGLECDIDDEYLWNLYVLQNGKCAISGVDIKFSSRVSKPLDSTASPDRIDSNKGYIKGNIQWIHKVIQPMKMDLPQDEFIEWCRIIVQNQDNNCGIDIK